MGNVGKLGELADGSVFFLLIRIGFFTIVVSAIHVIQRAIVRDGQISVFQNSNHTRENRYSFLYRTGVVLLKLFLLHAILLMTRTYTCKLVQAEIIISGTGN